MDSKIGNAELTGEAEGVEQKLHLDVTEIINKVILLTLKCPVGFRLAAISLRMMLWSQKFLTLSIYILSTW